MNVLELAGVIVVGIVVLWVVFRLYKKIALAIVTKLIRRGAFGQGQKWLMELIVDEDDETFARAANYATKMDLREAEILADDKGEFRNYVVDKVDDQTESFKGNTDK
jgi:hypothetical protein